MHTLLNGYMLQSMTDYKFRKSQTKQEVTRQHQAAPT